jgi:arylsulfatase A-like enzyme
MHTSEGMAVIAGPGVAHGRVERRHDVKDLTATLYGLAGADAPPDLEGQAIRMA